MTDFIVEKIKGAVANKEIQLHNAKVPRPPPDYPPQLFKLHTLGIFCGARNSGKTNACCLLIHEYLRQKCFTRVYVISPTFESNPVFNILKVKKSDVYTNAMNCIASINSIIHQNNEDWEKYEKHKAYVEVYKRWREKRHTFADQLVLEAKDYQVPPDLPMPSAAVIIDDMSHSDIYSTSRENPFINLCLRHRHMGISIFMLLQTFSTGAPKALRSNVQQFFVWKTNDIKVLYAMYSEFSGVCTYGQFLSVFDEATEEPHHFLTVDPFNEEEDHKFRKDFDHYLIIPNKLSLLKKIIEKEKKSLGDQTASDTTEEVTASRKRRRSRKNLREIQSTDESSK